MKNAFNHLLAFLIISSYSFAKTPEEWLSDDQYASRLHDDVVLPLDAYLTGDRRKFTKASRLIFASGFGSDSITFLSGLSPSKTSKSSEYPEYSELIYETSQWSTELNVRTTVRRLYYLTEAQRKSVEKAWRNLPPSNGKNEALVAMDDAAFVSSETLSGSNFEVRIFTNSKIIAGIYKKIEKVLAVADK